MQIKSRFIPFLVFSLVLTPILYSQQAFNPYGLKRKKNLILITSVSKSFGRFFLLLLFLFTTYLQYTVNVRKTSKYKRGGSFKVLYCDVTKWANYHTREETIAYSMCYRRRHRASAAGLLYLIVERVNLTIWPLNYSVNLF